MSEDLEQQLTSAENAFERGRQRVGLILAPLVFLGLLNAPGWSMPVPAQRLAAITAAVMVLWMTEPIPMPVTALLGASACVVLRVADAETVFAPFAHPLMFLFIGSFFLARAIYLHQLDRRLAYRVLSWSWVGASPSRILFAYGAISIMISAWISNTATTAMMLAIGLSIVRFLQENEARGGSAVHPQYITGLMLMTSFSASIGGLATPVGTPPNLIGLGFLQPLGIKFSFFQWCSFGMPLVIVLYLCLYLYLNFFCRAGVSRISGCDAMLRERTRELGPWTVGQKSTLCAFLVMVTLWIAPGFFTLIQQSGFRLNGWAFGVGSFRFAELSKHFPESVAALLGAVLLFILPGGKGRPVLVWKEATHIEWGVILIYGGGLALGVLSEKTGLGTAIGTALITWIPGTSDWSLMIVSCLVAVLLSELTSNTAAVTMVVPIVISLARAAKLDPLEPALGAILASSLGFMLPVSTPCNAIVYGSGHIPLSKMIRYGFLLDVIGVIVIISGVKVLIPWLKS